MEKSCPDCGAETGYVEHTARVLQGTCPGCGRTFTIVQESPAVSAGPSEAEPTGPAPGAGPSEPGTAPSPPSGPPCSVCGAALALRSSSDTSLEARCSSCSTTFTYVLATSPFPGPSRGPPFRGRPSPREDRTGFGPSRSRPCRECGGPLRFATDAEGNVTGECSSCGNRFTLPPRREFGGGGGDRRDRRGPNRPYPSSFRKPTRWARGDEGDRPPRFRPRPRGFRRDDRDADADEDEPKARRRRPRRE